MAERITWRDGEYGSIHGFVNDVRMFNINHSVTRGAGWELRGRLPGIKEHLGAFPETGEAKARAEAVLTRFMDRIGATFK
jgi:Ser/Thr protein kinase RdoA (MazF antagonist)